MRLLMIAALLLLNGCGSADTDPSGASPSEARQLNDAAAMLDDDSVSANAMALNQIDGNTQ